MQRQDGSKDNVVWNNYSKLQGIISKYQTKIGVRGNILLIKLNEFNSRSSNNYYLKWKQKEK